MSMLHDECWYGESHDHACMHCGNKWSHRNDTTYCETEAEFDQEHTCKECGELQYIKYDDKTRSQGIDLSLPVEVRVENQRKYLEESARKKAQRAEAIKDKALETLTELFGLSGW